MVIHLLLIKIKNLSRKVMWPIITLPLSFLGKVIETAAANSCQAFLNNSSALDPFPSDFGPDYGTEMALEALIDYLHLNMDKSHASLFLLLDLSTEFDAVELSRGGSRYQGCVLDWIK